MFAQVLQRDMSEQTCNGPRDIDQPSDGGWIIGRVQGRYATQGPTLALDGALEDCLSKIHRLIFECQSPATVA